MQGADASTFPFMQAWPYLNYRIINQMKTPVSPNLRPMFKLWDTLERGRKVTIRNDDTAVTACIAACQLAWMHV